jgi:hypothetical protein
MTGGSCQAGTCVGAAQIVCTAPDDCHEDGVCNPLTGFCSYPVRPNGTACDDGNLCTLADRCQGGVCVGPQPVVCGALDQCHLPGVCDPGSGGCTNPPAADGTVCDDGDRCTTLDSCRSGTCAGEVADLDGAQCVTGLFLESELCTRDDLAKKAAKAIRKQAKRVARFLAKAARASGAGQAPRAQKQLDRAAAALAALRGKIATFAEQGTVAPACNARFEAVLGPLTTFILASRG